MGKENPRPCDWVQVKELDSLQMSYARQQNDGVLTPDKGLSAWQNVLDEAEGEIRKQVITAYLLTLQRSSQVYLEYEEGSHGRHDQFERSIGNGVRMWQPFS